MLSPLLGEAAALRRDPLGTFVRGFREQGDVVHFPLGGPFTAWLLAHPADVERVLRTESTAFTKVPWHNARFRELLGTGIATSEGDRWLTRRRLAQPAFHRGRVDAMVETMTAAASEFAEEWAAVARGREIDMTAEMMRLTLTIACRTLFGADAASEARRLGPFIDTALRHVVRRMESLVALPLALPTPGNRSFLAARSELDAFIGAVITERRRSSSRAAETLLDVLLEAVDEETGRPLDDEAVRDEVMTMLMAGHESTAVGLSWTWYLLSQHPRWLDLMNDELERTLGGRSPRAGDLGDLALTGMVFDEALRLYPPAWATTRTPREPVRLRERLIRPGEYVILSPYVTHRHPGFWPDPEVFDPERFCGGVPRGPSRFSYFPFGGGPRQCLGLSFALNEAKVILAVLAQRFRPTYARQSAPELAPHVTLRPAGGLPMLLEPARGASGATRTAMLRVSATGTATPAQDPKRRATT